MMFFSKYCVFDFADTYPKQAIWVKSEFLSEKKFEFPAACRSEAKIPPTGVVAWRT